MGQHRPEAVGAGSVHCSGSCDASISRFIVRTVRRVGHWQPQSVDNVVTAQSVYWVAFVCWSSFPLISSRLKSHFHAFPSYNMACLFDVYNIRRRPQHCHTRHQVYYIFYYGSIHALRVIYQYTLYISWLARRILYVRVVQKPYDHTTPLPGLWHVQCCSIDWYLVLVPGTGAIGIIPVPTHQVLVLVPATYTKTYTLQGTCFLQ